MWTQTLLLKDIAIFFGKLIKIMSNHLSNKQRINEFRIGTNFGNISSK